MMASNSGSDARGLSLRVKLALYIGAWLIALLATNPKGDLWSLVWMFPIGLPAFVSPAAFSQGGWGPLLGSLALYITHGVLFFRTRLRRSTVLLSAILILMLVCNVAGCRAQIHSH